jgi:hypothetical protein
MRGWFTFRLGVLLLLSLRFRTDKTLLLSLRFRTDKTLLLTLRFRTEQSFLGRSMRPWSASKATYVKVKLMDIHFYNYYFADKLRSLER